MPHYQYKVVPAPRKGVKARNVKGAEARFAHAIEQRINELAAQGWQYLRAETLPSDDRTGLTGVTTTVRNILVFCRPVQDIQDVSGNAAPPESPTAEPTVSASR